VANPLSAHSFILDPDEVEYMLGMTGSTRRYDRSDVEEEGLQVFSKFNATQTDTVTRYQQLVKVLEVAEAG